MQRKQLAILTLDFPPQIGGVQQYLYEIGRRLTDMFEVIVITPTKGELPPSSQISRIIVSPPNFAHFYQAIHHIKPHLLWVGHAHPQLLLAARLSRLRYAAVAYGNDFLAAQMHWHRSLFNKLLARAEPLVTISQANAARLQSLGLPKPTVIYPGTDPNRFKPSQYKNSSGTTLLTISRLVPRKGIDTTLQAVALLIEQYPSLQYYIGGTGTDSSRLKALANKLGIASAVTFLDHVAPDTLPAVYQKADIFVMPTRERPFQGSIEGFGIVYLEASASGLPVVAAASGGAAEAVRDGETGLLVPSNNPIALAQTLDRLLQDRELRQKLGRVGRAWIENYMNWDHSARQFLAMLADRDRP